MKYLGWAAFAFSASAFFLPLMNPDIFWQLSAGKYAATHFAPPRFDFLSWPFPAKEWVAVGWASQLVFYLVHKAGGLWALFFLKAALLCLVLLVFRGLALLYKRPAFLPLALPVLAAVLSGGSDLRPENFTVLFFCAALYVLEKGRLEGLPRGLAFRLGAFLFFALWINLDPGCFYGLALLGLYAAGEFFSELLPRLKGGPGAGHGRSLEYLKLFITGLAATLANPYGWKIYPELAGHISRAQSAGDYLQGWAAGRWVPYHWLCVLAVLAVSAGLAYFALWRRHIVHIHLACLLFFAWAASVSSGSMPFLLLAGLAFALSLPWGGLPPMHGEKLLRGGAASWLLLSVWFYSSFIWPQYIRGASFFRTSSVNLAQFLKSNKKELSGLRLYNNGDWGSWLGWELAPDYKVFLDGRRLFEDRERELEEARASVGTWSGLIEKYKFDLMLITLNEPMVPVRQSLKGGKVELFWRPAYLFYLPKKDWAVVYWDYRVAAVVRRSALPAAWVAEREYRYLRPLDIPNLAQPVLAGEVSLSGLDRELRLFLDSHPGGKKASSNTALVSFCEKIKAACAEKGARCLL